MSAVATVKGGFWPEQGISSLTQISGVGSGRRRVAQALAQKGNLGLREIMETLNGVAPGSTATKTLSRIAASTEMGGVRTIQTETLVNRATTTGDRDAINADLLSLSARTYDPTPVVNANKNPLRSPGLF